jgi:hypothetical protein
MRAEPWLTRSGTASTRRFNSGVIIAQQFAASATPLLGQKATFPHL